MLLLRISYTRPACLPVCSSPAAVTPCVAMFDAQLVTLLLPDSRVCPFHGSWCKVMHDNTQQERPILTCDLVSAFQQFGRFYQVPDCLASFTQPCKMLQCTSIYFSTCLLAHLLSSLQIAYRFDAA